MRIKFRKGQQRKFLKKVIERTNSPSLRELSNRVQVSYSTFKNYFNESRILPKKLFEDLCFAANISAKDFFVEVLKENWGQVKGGKVCRK